MAGKNSANFKSSSPVKDAGLSSLKLGFKSRREHLRFSTADSGSDKLEASLYVPANHVNYEYCYQNGNCKRRYYLFNVVSPDLYSGVSDN